LITKQNLVFSLDNSLVPREDSSQNCLNFHTPQFLNISPVQWAKKMFGVAIWGTSAMADVTQYPRLLFTRDTLWSEEKSNGVPI
jgi:hypothetical protein